MSFAVTIHERSMFKMCVTIIFHNMKPSITIHGRGCGFLIFDVVENCRQMF